MTDCELIVLSAKAAGYVLTKESTNYREFMCRDGVEWNPLTRDGDALRLAVKLGMLFSYMGDRFDLFQKCYLECLDADIPPSKATRLAITRAAAEIGRSMK